MAAQWAAGGRAGMKDCRASTVTAMLDVVQSFLPRILFIENVAGFVKGKGSALPEIKHRLDLINLKEETSYKISWSIVDCALYGVPQHRKRAIIVAARDGLPFTFPPISHLTTPVTAWDAIGDIDPGPTPSLNGRWTELLPCIPEGFNYQWLTSRGGGNELFGYRTRYWSFLLKLARDRPSWTIPASPGPSTGPFHWDNRPLTIRELLRLQSFPIDWTLAGTHRDQVRLAGNATPPLLSEVIGRAMLHQLLERPVPADSPRLRVGHSHNPVPSPVPPGPLPTRFWPLVGPKAPHAGSGLGPGAHPRLSSDSFESASPMASRIDT